MSLDGDVVYKDFNSAVPAASPSMETKAGKARNFLRRLQECQGLQGTYLVFS